MNTEKMGKMEKRVGTNIPIIFKQTNKKCQTGFRGEESQQVYTTYEKHTFNEDTEKLKVKGRKKIMQTLQES